MSEEAESVLKDFLGGSIDLRAPKLVVYEVGNTLWKAVKQGFIDLHEAAQRLSHFLRLRIDTIELDDEGRGDALRWGVKNGLTYYDSLYVESSRRVGAILLTADDVLYEKARKETPTLHLRDYKE